MAKYARRIEETVKRESYSYKNGKHLKTDERRVGTMLEALKDVVLYFPRKIYMHFKTYNDLARENTELTIALENRDRIFKRIVATAERNSYYDKEQQIRKMKELALTFTDENTSSKDNITINF